MKKSRILVVGSSNTDMIVQLKSLPGPGVTVIGGKFSTAPGGKGANQAVGAARAGGNVAFIGKMGRDAFGTSALENLQRDGIDVSRVARDPKAPSGVAFIFVIAVASGSNDLLSVADVEAARDEFRKADIVLVQLETPLPTVIATARLAAKAGALVILNPAPARQLPDSLLRHVSILTPNEHEAELLTGIKVVDAKSASKAAESLMKRGVGTVIVTLGSKGAFIAQGTNRELMAGFKVRAVDTTAAGDIFNGALAVALGEGTDLASAVRFAQAAAAISVTRAGAQPSAPKRSEIERLVRRGRLDTKHNQPIT